MEEEIKQFQEPELIDTISHILSRKCLFQNNRLFSSSPLIFFIVLSSISCSLPSSDIFFLFQSLPQNSLSYYDILKLVNFEFIETSVINVVISISNWISLEITQIVDSSTMREMISLRQSLLRDNFVPLAEEVRKMFKKK